MAEKTYSISTFVAAGARDNALIAFFNSDTTNRYTFEIRNLEFINLTQTEVSVYPDPYSLEKITNVVGGTDIPMTKLDTLAPDIPSQVKIVSYPNNITIDTTASPFRNIVRVYPASAELITPLFTYHSKLWDAGKENSNQGIELQEGQGLSLVPNNNVFNQGNIIELTIRIGSWTYIGTFDFHGDYGNFAIFNGTGSGVVIQVIDINLRPIAGINFIGSTTDNAPTVRFCKIYGINENTGANVNVNCHNGSGITNSALTIKKGSLVNPMYVRLIEGLEDYYTNFTLNVIGHSPIRIVNNFHQRMPRYGNAGQNNNGTVVAGSFLSVGMGQSARYNKYGFRYCDSTVRGYRILPGTGFALIGNNNRFEMNSLYVQAQIVQISNATYFSHS